MNHSLIFSPRVLTSFLIAAVGIFFLTTRRPGHTWGDDFAMYIMHAENIAAGRPYAPTPFLFDPANPIGPRAYPPGLPLLLAPVVFVAGIQLELFKMEIIFFFLVLLAALYASSEELGSDARVLLVGAVGLHPFLWLFKDNILSDIPFLMFCYLAFYSFRKSTSERSASKARWEWMTGLLILLGVATRPVGLALLVALAFWCVSHRQKPKAWMLTLLCCSAVLMAVERHWNFDHSYFASFHLQPLFVLRNAKTYVESFISFWTVPAHPATGVLFIAVTGLLAVGGIVRQVRSNVRLRDSFFLIYALMLPFCRYNEFSRYLIPLIPGFLYYALRGLPARTSWRKALGLWVFVLWIATLYLFQYRSLSFGPVPDGIEAPAAQDLFRYIRAQTTPSDVIVFQKPRALALFTGRRTSYYHPGTDAEIWAYQRAIGATLWITRRHSPDPTDDFAEHQPRHFQLLYANSEFRVWKVKDALTQKQP